MPGYILMGFGEPTGEHSTVQFEAENDTEAILQAKRTVSVDDKFRFSPELFRTEKVFVDFTQCLPRSQD